MRMFRRFLAVCLALLIMAPAASAQDHVIGKAALDKAVQQRVSQEQADRDAILSLLQRQEVRDIAAKAGLSIEKARDGRDDAAWKGSAEAAQQARQAQDSLAGGASTIVISTTTVIIVLLHHHPHCRHRGLTTRAALRLVIAAATLTAAMPVPSAPAQAPAAQLHLLDVPYLPQTELLCGGAAIAMVMRYWGVTNVYAETFADLVDAAAGGIHGGDMVQGASRDRGWDADSITRRCRPRSGISLGATAGRGTHRRIARVDFTTWSSSAGRAAASSCTIRRALPFAFSTRSRFCRHGAPRITGRSSPNPARLAATGTVPGGVTASAAADGTPRADAEGHVRWVNHRRCSARRRRRQVGRAASVRDRRRELSGCGGTLARDGGTARARRRVARRGARRAPRAVEGSA